VLNTQTVGAECHKGIHSVDFAFCKRAETRPKTRETERLQNARTRVKKTCKPDLTIFNQKNRGWKPLPQEDIPN